MHTLNGVISSFLDAAILTSEVFGISADPNNVCLQDRLVYTCTVPIVLTWTVRGIQIGSYVSSTVVGAMLTNGALPGVVANLTDPTEVNGTILTSTLTIPSAGSVPNGSVIRCDGLSGNSNSTVLRHRGKIPGCCTWARYCDVQVCHDRLVYTCTVPIVLFWTVGTTQIGAYVSSTVVGATRMNGALPGVVANLTEVNGTALTSTLTIPSAGSVPNGSVILCEGLSLDSNSTVLRHRGKYLGVARGLGVVMFRYAMTSFPNPPLLQYCKQQRPEMG